MIKKLRLKFVLIAMISFFAVISLILGILDFMIFSYLDSATDEVLTILAEGYGKMPEAPLLPEDTPQETPDSGDEGADEETGEGENDDSSEEDEDEPPEYIIYSVETPFESRYFTVTLTSAGEWIESNVTHIAAISEEDAKRYATAVFGDKSGKMDVYKYTSITLPHTELEEAEGEEAEERVMYIFLDCRRETTYQSYFLYTSIIIGGIGLALVFILILLASGSVTKPIERNNEKQKRFITNASHEIKTPITIIDANTELIEIESGESEWTEGIKKQTKRLVSLTEKLVTLTRLEENPHINAISFSISGAVAETAEPYKAIAAAKSREFTYEVEEDVILSGDEAEIRQLVSILLDNAMKYSNEGGNISLSLTTALREIKLTVTNSTGGIKKGNLDMLFERFYRSDKARASASHGSGIGLSVAEAIVNSHKGRISAYSPDGVNIAFTVVFTKPII